MRLPWPPSPAGARRSPSTASTSCASSADQTWVPIADAGLGRARRRRARGHRGRAQPSPPAPIPRRPPCSPSTAPPSDGRPWAVTARIGGRVAGAAWGWSSGSVVILADLAVAAAHRTSASGRKLLAAVEAEAASAAADVALIAAPGEGAAAALLAGAGWLAAGDAVADGRRLWRRSSPEPQVRSQSWLDVEPPDTVNLTLQVSITGHQETRAHPPSARDRLRRPPRCSASPLAATTRSSDDTRAAPPGDGPSAEPVTLHLGYFPNLTHAPALVGVQEGLFEENLPDNVTLETANVQRRARGRRGPLRRDLDITYIGPNPAINAYAQSDGEAVRIIAGSTSGGAALVVRDGHRRPPSSSRAPTLATPQLGNTQDVALRTYLADNGYETDEAGGGDVSIRPAGQRRPLAAFQSGDIDGAWVPEPFATRLQSRGRRPRPRRRGRPLAGRRLRDHPRRSCARRSSRTTPTSSRRSSGATSPPSQAIEDDPAAAQAAANAQIEAITTGRLVRRGDRRRLAEPPVHLRPDRLVAGGVGAPTPRRSACSTRSTSTGIYDLSILNRSSPTTAVDEVAGIVNEPARATLLGAAAGPGGAPLAAGRPSASTGCRRSTGTAAAPCPPSTASPSRSPPGSSSASSARRAAARARC